MRIFHVSHHLVGLLHVQTRVFVVGEDHDIVAPQPFGRFAGIGEDLVHSRLGVALRGDREAPQRHRQAVATHVHTRVVLKEGHDVIGGVAGVVVQAVLGEPCRKGRYLHRSHRGGDAAEIVGGTAHQQHIAQLPLPFGSGVDGALAAAAVVEHLEHLAEGLHIGHTRGELVVDLLRGLHQHLQRLYRVVAVEIGQALGLRLPFGRGEDHHIGHREGVEVLRLHIFHKLGRGEGAAGLPGHIRALFARYAP